ncbi:MAG: bifunctional folylpolyglutamate synthase/dihydrofolate synthase, partial [Thermoanaerobaculia bacterium]
MSRERVDARLAPLERLGIRLDLAPMRQLLAAAGDPQLAVPVVLVAGTNGKGSTAAMLAAIATAAGLRTGLATSPHLERVEERIRFDGEPIDPSRLAPLLDRLLECAAAAGLAPPTYFEVTTAAAFLAFAADPVDLAIVEVGLGGRLDAANAAEPILSLITPIALDHTEWLGTTLAAVATEKAG